MILAKGRYRNQVIELDAPIDLPEGSVVEVDIELEADVIRRQEARASLSEALKGLAGTAEGLPEDMSRNVDHYLHGQPKQ